MAYQHDDQAAAEAAQYVLPENRLADVQALVFRKRDELGPGGVRGHQVSYKPTDWNGLLPEVLSARDTISRGDVFDIAQTGDLPAVFAASFLWGTGERGYGPHRYREVVDSTEGRLAELLSTAKGVAESDLIGGYASFYGGFDPKLRAAPNTAPWTRIDNFGPAFFTKFLYFTTPGALILDNVLATRINELCGMPYLVQSNGQSYQWSPYRYSVYLHWMRDTAMRLSCAPAELEITLFASPRPKR